MIPTMDYSCCVYDTNHGLFVLCEWYQPWAIRVVCMILTRGYWWCVNCSNHGLFVLCAWYQPWAIRVVWMIPTMGYSYCVNDTNHRLFVLCVWYQPWAILLLCEWYQPWAIRVVCMIPSHQANLLRAMIDIIKVENVPGVSLLTFTRLTGLLFSSQNTGKTLPKFSGELWITNSGPTHHCLPEPSEASPLSL